MSVALAFGANTTARESLANGVVEGSGVFGRAAKGTTASGVTGAKAFTGILSVFVAVDSPDASVTGRGSEFCDGAPWPDLNALRADGLAPLEVDSTSTVVVAISFVLAGKIVTLVEIVLPKLICGSTATGMRETRSDKNTIANAELSAIKR